MVWLRLAGILVCVALAARAQEPCPPAPAYSPCDILFELNDAEAQAHPNPYLSVQIQAEFRSPRHRTLLLPAFWDGGRRMIIRFTPNDPGEWVYRITGNVERFNDKQGKLTATESDSPGFIRPANVHHWMYTEQNKPHLWMGDTSYRFSLLDMPAFQRVVDTRAAQKFNHLRGLLLGDEATAKRTVPAPDRIDPEHFKRLDERIVYMNRKGIIADLILGGDRNQLAELLPTWQSRERFVRYVASRYAALNVTWQLVQEYEEYPDGRALMKELGELVKKFDPYQHPRSTHTLSTSAPLNEDGWMDYILYQSSDDALGAIEHQMVARPQVNAEFGYEDSGAGKSHPHHVATDEFRRRLWNATMNGQYVTFGNTGVYGGKQVPFDVKWVDSPGAKQMTAWFDFMSRTRWWDLEPYFDVSGGRALALESIEYIVYLEKPGLVEVLTEKHGYDVFWFNPLTGELIKEKKEYKGEKFTGEPPDKTHDWILHLSREGKKEGMLKSYRFEARRVELQEVETSPEKATFEIEQPKGDVLKMSQPPAFAVKLKRETRASRGMIYLWTGEVAVDGQGYRVLGTGPKGTLRFPPDLAKKFPATLSLRVYGLNGVGKLYSLDQLVRLEP